MKKLIKLLLREGLNEERQVFDVLYHGTDIESAKNIKQHGVSMAHSYGGYFGTGFYTTPDFNLAKSNYADFSDGDEAGVILEFKLLPNANILDLGDAKDFELWKKFSRHLGEKMFHQLMVNNKIDGLWDNSFEGVVIYNPKVLKLVNVLE